MIPTPRPYQLEALKAIFRELYYRKSTLRVAATGTGKTCEMGFATRIHLRNPATRVMVTAPREELLEQAEVWIRRCNPALSEGAIGWELGPKRAHEGHRVILASLDSLSGERIAALPVPTLILGDEGHLYYEKNRLVAAAFPTAQRIYFSATPDRLDQQRLIPALAESVAAVYELADAIRDGWCVPFRFLRREAQDLRLDQKMVSPTTGDFERETLSKIMRRQGVMDETVATLLEHRGDRQTIVFAVDIAHAEELHARLACGIGREARLVHGNLPHRERKAILTDFKAEKFSVLVSVALVLYGYDCPPVSCILSARPTTSRALWSQKCGRGGRPHPGKHDCLVLDLVGNTEGLNLITPEEALQPDPAFGIVPPAGQQVERQIAEEELGRYLMAGADEKPLPAEARAFRLTEIDNQLLPLGVDPGKRRSDLPPATVAQVLWLRTRGIKDSTLLDKQQASRLIDQLKAREAAGYATLKQAWQLYRHGLNPNVSFDLASEAMEKLAGHSWRPPRSFALWAKSRGLLARGPTVRMRP